MVPGTTIHHSTSYTIVMRHAALRGALRSIIILIMNLIFILILLIIIPHSDRHHGSAAQAQVPQGDLVL